MDRQSQLTQRDGESQAAHRAFLLWLMQEPAKRSARAAARAIDYSDAMIRQWKTKFEWQQRAEATGAGSDTLAARAYSTLYHRVAASKEIALVQKYMVVTYLPPDAAAPGLGTAPPPPKPELSEPAKAIQLHGTSAEEAVTRRNKRIDQILDGVIVRIGEAVTDNKLKVSVGDLLTINKVRREMQTVSTSGGTSSQLATSVRVENAIAAGENVLDALIEDHEELGLIFQVLKESDEHSNVLPFPGGRVQAKTAAG